MKNLLINIYGIELRQRLQENLQIKYVCVYIYILICKYTYIYIRKEEGLKNEWTDIQIRG